MQSPAMLSPAPSEELPPDDYSFSTSSLKSLSFADRVNWLPVIVMKEKAIVIIATVERNLVFILEPALYSCSGYGWRKNSPCQYKFSGK